MIPQLKPIPNLQPLSPGLHYYNAKTHYVASKTKPKSAVLTTMRFKKNRSKIPRVSQMVFTKRQAKHLNIKQFKNIGYPKKGKHKVEGYRQQHKRILGEDVLKQLGAKMTKADLGLKR